MACVSILPGSRHARCHMIRRRSISFRRLRTPCRWAQWNHDTKNNREPEMKFQPPLMHWVALSSRIRGMFNLNDSRWGRGDDKQSDGSRLPRARMAGGAGRGRPRARRISTNCGVTSTVNSAACSAATAALDGAAMAVAGARVPVVFSQT